MQNKTSEIPLVSSENLILVRSFNEISLKSNKTFKRFMHLLRGNIAQNLKNKEVRCHLVQYTNKFYLFTDNKPLTAALLKNTFGVGSFSEIEYRTGCTVEEIVQLGVEKYSNKVKGKTFAVRCKIVGAKKLSSKAVEIALGTALNPLGTVNLTKPHVQINIEINNNKEALFYTNKVECVGGMPLGSQGKVLSLISGGFDSAVSTFEIAKKGLMTDFLFFNLGGKAYERLVLQIVKVFSELWLAGKSPRMAVVDFKEVITDLKENVRPKYRQIVLKRLMYMAAEKLAKDHGYEGLVTGESLGQVSSQTITNLKTIEDAVDIMVLRPLLTLDKKEIMIKSKKVGTYILSGKVKEYCAISDGPQAVSAKKENVLSEEKNLNLNLIDEAIESRALYNVNKLNATSLREPFLFKEVISGEDTIIDLQDKGMFNLWHIPGAKNISPSELIKNFKTLDKNKKYLLYCSFGTQTPYVVEVLQQQGYEAYAFRGGISQVKNGYKIFLKTNI